MKHSSSGARRPRVLQLFTSLNRGGMEKQTLGLCRGLVEGGRYEVLAAALGAEGPLLEELHALGVCDVPLYATHGLASPSGAAAILGLARYLRAHRVDVIHTHDFYTTSIGLTAAALARTPVRIAGRRELDVFTPTQRRVERLACRSAQRVLANCRFLHDQLLDEGYPPEQVDLLYNAIEPYPDTPERSRAEILASIGADDETRLVVMVANLHSTRKDPATVVRAWTRVVTQVPTAHLVLLGAGEPRPELREALAACACAEHVHVTGLQTDVASWLLAADVCVLCSHSEGLPNAVMEYMAAGRPLVASDVGGIPELVRHDVSGILVPPGNVGAVANGVVMLLENRPRADALGRAARVAVESFNPASQRAQLEAVYDSLLRSCRRLPPESE